MRLVQMVRATISPNGNFSTRQPHKDKTMKMLDENGKPFTEREMADHNTIVDLTGEIKDANRTIGYDMEAFAAIVELCGHDGYSHTMQVVRFVKRQSDKSRQKVEANAAQTSHENDPV